MKSDVDKERTLIVKKVAQEIKKYLVAGTKEFSGILLKAVLQPSNRNSHCCIFISRMDRFAGKKTILRH